LGIGLFRWASGCVCCVRSHERRPVPEGLGRRRRDARLSRRSGNLEDRIGQRKCDYACALQSAAITFILRINVARNFDIEAAMNESPIVHSHPEIVSGEPVFVGTRVPVRNLLDWVEGGHTLDEFLDNFPSVTRNQAVAFLEQAANQACR
jgi:uncharacterized protein (DUF433 family)